MFISCLDFIFLELKQQRVEKGPSKLNNKVQLNKATKMDDEVIFFFVSFPSTESTEDEIKNATTFKVLNDLPFIFFTELVNDCRQQRNILRFQIKSLCLIYGKLYGSFSSYFHFKSINWFSFRFLVLHVKWIFVSSEFSRLNDSGAKERNN